VLTKAVSDHQADREVRRDSDGTIELQLTAGMNVSLAIRRASRGDLEAFAVSIMRA
jgi:hypothetical protein